MFLPIDCLYLYGDSIMENEKGLDHIILFITSQITETEKKSHYLVYHKSDN